MEYMDDLYAGVCSGIRSVVWSNTAMKMPSKIYTDRYGYWDYEDDEHAVTTPYIRADIADELARALEMVQVWLSYDGRYDMHGIDAALTRFHTLTAPAEGTLRAQPAPVGGKGSQNST